MKRQIFNEQPAAQHTFAFTLQAYAKLCAYVKYANGEVGGWGKVRRMTTKQGKEGWLCTDVKIFEQVCTDAHTTMTQDDQARFYTGLIQAGENPGRWNLWWHSHNDFEAYLSPEDRDTIREFSDGNMLFAVCINKDCEMFGEVHENQQLVADLDVVVVPNGYDRNMRRRAQREVKRKVGEDMGQEFEGDLDDPDYEISPKGRWGD